MNALIITVLALMAFLRWLQAWRLRKLSEFELKIARSVTAMEKLMLAGEIKCGAVSHDDFFQVMQAVMILRRYRLPWAFWHQPSEEINAFSRRLADELNEKDCPFRDIFEQFNHSYFMAFKYKHPFQYFAFPVYLLACYALAKGIVQSYHAVKRLRNRKEKLMREYVTRTAPSLVEQEATMVFDGKLTV